MANTLLFVDLIGNNVLARLVNSLGLAVTANRDYEAQFSSGKVWMIGSSLRIRQPVYFTAVQYTGPGSPLVPQDVIENFTTLTISNQWTVGVAFTSQEEVLFLQDPQTNVYQGAAQELANLIDLSLVNAGMSAFNRIVGNPGAGATSYSVANAGITENRKYGVKNSRYMAWNPSAAGDLRNALNNQFNKMMNTEICEVGVLGNISGCDNFEDQNLQSHTTGSFGLSSSAPIVAGAGQSGSTINLSGFGAAVDATVLADGDHISFAGVYGVNPVSRVPVAGNTLMQFLVVGDTACDITGAATVTISPAIILTGPYQNVSAGPAASAPVSLYGLVTHGTPAVYAENFCFSPDAFTLAVVPMPVNYGTPYSKVFTDPDTGIAIRLNIAYSYGTDQDLLRFDTLWGGMAFSPYGTTIAT